MMIMTVMVSLKMMEIVMMTMQMLEKSFGMSMEMEMVMDLESLQTESCTRPEGYADQIGDCDDDDSDINPEAIEICDSKDNDCDLLVDDDDSEWLKKHGNLFYND